MHLYDRSVGLFGTNGIVGAGIGHAVGIGISARQQGRDDIGVAFFGDGAVNHGAFHEDCTVAIGKKLVETLNPHWLRIGGYWYPRGGIPIDVFFATGDLPEGVWLPDQGISHYRGRG